MAVVAHSQQHQVQPRLTVAEEVEDLLLVLRSGLVGLQPFGLDEVDLLSGDRHVCDQRALDYGGVAVRVVVRDPALVTP